MYFTHCSTYKFLMVSLFDHAKLFETQSKPSSYCHSLTLLQHTVTCQIFPILEVKKFVQILSLSQLHVLNVSRVDFHIRWQPPHGWVALTCTAPNPGAGEFNMSRGHRSRGRKGREGRRRKRRVVGCCQLMRQPAV